MKRGLIFGLMLGTTWLGIAEPGKAMPLRLAKPSEPPATSLLVPVRHHHHRWHHRHGRRGGIEYYSLYPDAAAGEGQSGPSPPDMAGGSAYSGFAEKPSIRWVNPDKPAR